jgi:hypothetical protein
LVLGDQLAVTIARRKELERTRDEATAETTKALVTTAAVIVCAYSQSAQGLKR